MVARAQRRERLLLPRRRPADAVAQAFDPRHLEGRDEDIGVGDALTIAGFPLGFHDAVHHLAVARSASVALACGVRFQRQGCVLTDARTHRGSSGSPVVRRRVHDDGLAARWPGRCWACIPRAWTGPRATARKTNRWA